MDCEFPLTSEQQEGLDKLSNNVDVFLLFNDNWVSEGKSSSKIDKMKFTCLYDCLGYIDVKNESSTTLMKVFDYVNTIKESSGFLNYSLVKCSKLGEFSNELLHKWLEYCGNVVFKTPVFSIERLNPEDLFNIYKLDEQPKNPSRFGKFVNIVLGIEKAVKKKDFDYSNAYCRYKTSSWFIPYKRDLIIQFINFFNEESGKEYIGTFKSLDPTIAFSSLCAKLGLDVFNADFKNCIIKGSNLLKKED
jgi:hypothetical protein